MTTKFIGVKTLRQNMKKISDQALKTGQRIIVMRRSEPLFELLPIPQEDRSMERLIHRVYEGLEDKKQGRIHTQEEIEAILDIN